MLLGALFLQAGSAAAQEKCFTRLDTGVDMAGWHKSDTNHHGPGLGWTIENGAFVGRQTGTNLGGIMLTDKTYKDVEVIFQVKIDWGCDSGFFFRTTAGDRAYQVNVDHLQDAGVGTIYGEGFSQELRYRPYFLSNMGMTATKDPVLTPMFDLTKWSTIWHPTDFNELRARVEGNPPHMQVWIAGTQVMDFTDTMLRPEIDAAGPLAIQVHGGAERWIANGTVAFKNIRVKDLTVPCVDDGSGGSGGVGGAGGGVNTGGTSGTGGASGAGSPSGGVTSGGVTSGGTTSAGAGSGSANAGATTSSGSGGVETGIPNEGYAGATTTGATPSDSSGCGCRATRSSGSGSAALILVGLAYAANARARRGWPRATPRPRHEPRPTQTS